MMDDEIRVEQNSTYTAQEFQHICCIGSGLDSPE